MLSKISDQKYDIFSNSISNQDIDTLINLINTMKIDFKVRAKLKELILPLSESLCLEWGTRLSKMDTNHIIISGILLEKIMIWSRDKDFTIDLILSLSASSNWKIREVAINLLFKGLANEFINYKNLFSKLTNSPDPNQRRVAVRTAKNISSHSTKNEELKPWIILEIVKYLKEQDNFVLRAAIETYTTGFVKYCPEIFLDSIDRIIQEDPEPEIKLNILRAINGLIDIQYIERILNIIDYFVFDTDESNKIAQLAVLKTLTKVNSKKVSIWLEERMGIENVVEYWAKLAVEGFIVDEFLY